MHLRLRAYRLLNPIESGEPAGRAIEAALLVLIFGNMLALILESVKVLQDTYGVFFTAFEVFSVLIFTIEYLVRVWCVVENPKYRSPVAGRLRYITSAIAIVDLLAIIPFYLSFLPVDLRFIRSVRLFRLFRLLKVARYLKALKLIQTVLSERKEQIYLSVMFIAFLLIVISTLMFYMEHDAQPEVFSSIPASMWWG